MHDPSIDAFAARLSQALRDAPPEPIDLTPVLRRARTRLAARSVLGLLLGRIWLALARLLAPGVVRLHRWALHRKH
jgi:hypothetical protein